MSFHCTRPLEVADLFAVFHRRLAALVIRAGATFGDARGGDFGDDFLEVARG